MLFWICLAAMTAAAMFAVLWPLSRQASSPARAAYAGAVYRDQLAEVERDRTRGLIGESEAEAARTEIGRRLLRTDSEASTHAAASGTRRRIAAMVALLGIPALALPLYLGIGRPEMPDAPLAARNALSIEKQDIGMLIGRLEQRLAQTPDDGKGWELIATIYARVGRLEDAIGAHNNAIRLLGSSAERQTALGEALTAAASGKVTAEARAAFERALEHNADFSPALYYLGLANEQVGNLAGARAAWTRIIEKNDARDMWRLPAQRALNRTRPAQ